jgi:hypothetical protein
MMSVTCRVVPAQAKWTSQSLRDVGVLGGTCSSHFGGVVKLWEDTLDVPILYLQASLHDRAWQPRFWPFLQWSHVCYKKQDAHQWGSRRPPGFRVITLPAARRITGMSGVASALNHSVMCIVRIGLIAIQVGYWTCCNCEMLLKLLIMSV